MARLVAPMTVQSVAGETVDELVYRTLGKSSPAVEQVLAANPNLADHGLHLPRDLAVVIPTAASGPADTPMIQLWT